MLRIHTALALVFSFGFHLASGAQAPPATAAATAATSTPSSPLGMEPAVVQYISNNAPFVLFDVAPRSLNARLKPDVGSHAQLSFLATDLLNSVNVFVIVQPGADAAVANGSGMRTACGSKIAGYYTCAIPTERALVQFKGSKGQLALRIEAEGVEGDRSIVLVTLPVKGAAPRAPARPVESRQGLSFLSATPAR